MSCSKLILMLPLSPEMWRWSRQQQGGRAAGRQVAGRGHRSPLKLRVETSSRLRPLCLTLSLATRNPAHNN